MDKIKVALVGCGNVGQVVHLPILQRMPDVEIVAVVDPDKRKVQAVAARAGIPNYFTDIEQLLASSIASDIQAIDICSSTDAHKPIALAALAAGKDVLVEKPIARTYKEAKEMVDAAAKYGRKLMVGMNNRFRPDTMILKTFIEKEELGKIFYIKSGWLKQQSSLAAWHQQKEKSGGGVFLDMGIVMLDMALWLLNYPAVLSVSASAYNQQTKTVEDSAAVFARLENDVTLTIEVSWTFHREGDFFYCNVFGADGSAFINPLRVFKRVHGSLVNLTPVKTQTPLSLYKKSYENELRHFINAVKDLVPLISSGEESARRMQVVEAIYQSAAKHKEIVLAAPTKKARKK
ncbi:MAG: Gfo/Idh/MocA family oxidoreductase [Candidatus Kapaibacterium sp.]|jgi:predicted dehydrogenase